MKAGNRCFDQRVPEEINRKIVDHLSDINLPLSEQARDYLIAEGIRPETVIKTGSPMKEVLIANMKRGMHSVIYIYIYIYVARPIRVYSTCYILLLYLYPFKCFKQRHDATPHQGANGPFKMCSLRVEVRWRRLFRNIICLLAFPFCVFCLYYYY